MIKNNLNISLKCYEMNKNKFTGNFYLKSSSSCINPFPKYKNF